MCYFMILYHLLQFIFAGWIIYFALFFDHVVNIVKAKMKYSVMKPNRRYIALIASSLIISSTFVFFPLGIVNCKHIPVELL